MSEIKVNLENLKDDEREQLLTLIEKANKKAKRFKPEVGGVYWSANFYNGASIFIWRGDSDDLASYKSSNCFATKEEAEFEAEKRKVLAELEIFAIENDDEIEWKSDHQEKYNLYYDHREGALKITWSLYCQNQGDIYFSSEELCEQAIEKVGADRIKKYLFGVEE